MTTHCRLLCHDLDSGAGFFWRRFGLLSKFFDLLFSSVNLHYYGRRTISGKLLAVDFAAMMRPLSNYFDLLYSYSFLYSATPTPWTMTASGQRSFAVSGPTTWNGLPDNTVRMRPCACSASPV